MALNADALTTVSHLKEELGIASGDTSKDSRLERLINRATADVERKTGRKLKCREYNNEDGTHPITEVADEDYIYFSGATKDEGGDTLVDERGYGLLYLPAWPVQANDANVTFTLATLSDRDSDIAGGESWDTTDLTEWDDYVVDRENGVLRLLSGRFTSGHRNYRITCAAGYLEGGANDDPNVPADLEELCILVCKRLYRDDAGLMSEKMGSWSRTFDPQKANEQINEGISLFRRWSL